MNFLDLFSGIGGFALGAQWAGLQFGAHYFSEVDDYAIRVYQRRFPDAIPLGDIRTIRGAALPASKWIIAGGFPCQDISVAGKGAGIQGARSGLWFEYARLIGELRPRYAIMENVGALISRGLDTVLGSLVALGYDAEWQDIRASDMGAPHRRERIWIVAYPQRYGIRNEPGRSSGQDRADKAEPRDNGATWSLANSQEVRRGEGDAEPCRAPEGTGAAGERGGLSDSGEICDADFQGLAQREGQPGDDGAEQPAAIRTDWWAVEPDVGRVAHGVPARVDRLKCLGNSIVPQIAEMILKSISDLDSVEAI